MNPVGKLEGAFWWHRLPVIMIKPGVRKFVLQGPAVTER